MSKAVRQAVWDFAMKAKSPQRFLQNDEGPHAGWRWAGRLGKSRMLVGKIVTPEEQKAKFVDSGQWGWFSVAFECTVCSDTMSFHSLLFSQF